MTTGTAPGTPPPPARRPGDRLLTAAEVAERLGGGTITPETVIRRWRKWGLTGCRVGKFLRWPESSVDDYINSHPA